MSRKTAFNTHAVATPPLPASSNAARPAAREKARAVGQGKASAAPEKRTLWDTLFGIDLRALGVFRIGLALLLLIDLAGRAMDLSAHYTDAGVLPRPAVVAYNDNYWAYVSPYMWVGNAAGVAALMILAAVCTLAFLAGWQTRWSSIATWYLLISIQTRNPLILHGGDSLLRSLAFWAMFTPLGARFSLDAPRRIRQAMGIATPSRALSVGTAGLLLQIGFLYWFTALLKSGPEWRQNGTALYYALSFEQYGTPFGYWLRSVRWLMKPLTWATLVLEAAGPTLAFLPLATTRIRLFIVPVFMIFHLIILNLSLDLGPLPYVTTLAWVLFLPTVFWDGAARLWVRGTARGNKIVGALERARLGMVAARDTITAGRREKGLPETAPPLRLFWMWQIAAAFALVYIFIWNVRTVNFAAVNQVLPQGFDNLSNFTRIDQNWGMFAPRPSTDDGWYIIPGKLANGQERDIFRNQPVDWNKPVYIASLYKSERWRKYLMNLWNRGNVIQRGYYSQWLCRTWNTSHSSADQLKTFQIYYMLKETQPDYAVSVPVKVDTWDQACATQTLGGSGGLPGQKEGLMLMPPTGPLPTAEPKAGKGADNGTH